MVMVSIMLCKSRVSHISSFNAAFTHHETLNLAPSAEETVFLSRNF
jgi:hypothetical protein